MTTIAKIGRIVCATVVCPDVDQAATLYTAALDYTVIDKGVVTAELADSWGADKMSGAAFVVLAPKSGAPSYLRFVEISNAAPPTPYLTAGWTALEFTVQSSDAVIDRLTANGFTVLGAAEDLEFCDGALRAGQVLGPYGEVLYLTQINQQLDDYVLPPAKSEVDKQFIVILATSNVEKTMEYFASHHSSIAKETFEAAVPFIADFHQIEKSTEFLVGTVELEDENYIEIDGMPTAIKPRPYEEGYLPTGIAMMTFETENLDTFAGQARGTMATSSSKPYGGKRSVVFNGQQGEWIEIVEQ